MNFEKRPYLDSLRGLAALIVVMCHYAGAFYPFAIFNTHGLDGDSGRYKQMSIFDSLFHQTPLGLFVAGHFAVCLFFILSGYVLSYKFVQIKPDRNEVLGAVIKRPIRLGGTVVFTIALSYLCMRISGYQNHRVAQFTNSVPWFESFWESTPALRTFLADVILRPFQAGAKYNPPLWTIAMELYGSFLVYFYLLLFGNHKYRAIGIMTLMLYFWNTLYVGFCLE